MEVIYGSASPSEATSGSFLEQPVSPSIVPYTLRLVWSDCAPVEDSGSEVCSWSFTSRCFSELASSDGESETLTVPDFSPLRNSGVCASLGLVSTSETILALRRLTLRSVLATLVSSSLLSNCSFDVEIDAVTVLGTEPMGADCAFCTTVGETD